MMNGKKKREKETSIVCKTVWAFSYKRYIYT